MRWPWVDRLSAGMEKDLDRDLGARAGMSNESAMWAVCLMLLELDVVLHVGAIILLLTVEP